MLDTTATTLSDTTRVPRRLRTAYSVLQASVTRNELYKHSGFENTHIGLSTKLESQRSRAIHVHSSATKFKALDKENASTEQRG